MKWERIFQFRNFSENTKKRFSDLSILFTSLTLSLNTKRKPKSIQQLSPSANTSHNDSWSERESFYLKNYENTKKRTFRRRDRARWCVSVSFPLTSCSNHNYPLTTIDERIFHENQKIWFWYHCVRSWQIRYVMSSYVQYIMCVKKRFLSRNFFSGIDCVSSREVVGGVVFYYR